MTTLAKSNCLDLVHVINSSLTKQVAWLFKVRFIWKLLPSPPSMTLWIVTQMTRNHSVILAKCVGQHVWPFPQLHLMSDSERSPPLETEDRTRFSHFMYKDLRDSSLSARGATQQIQNSHRYRTRNYKWNLEIKLKRLIEFVFQI